MESETPSEQALQSGRVEHTWTLRSFAERMSLREEIPTEHQYTVISTVFFYSSSMSWVKLVAA